MTHPLRRDVPLSSYTVFRTGGTARFFQEVTSVRELADTVAWARAYHLPFCVIGAGSNVLAHDAGFPGLVVKPLFSDTAVVGNVLVADAGAMMPAIAARAYREGLTGLEWAGGIPGTVGGSVRGNAGCFGSSVSDRLEWARVFDCATGKEKKFSRADCRFGYRDSIFKKHPEYVIVSASFSLAPEAKPIISRVMQEHALRRVATQDIGASCAGCVFKNVSWEALSYSQRRALARALPDTDRFRFHTHIPAAFLIDRLGLKGRTIGGASVSSKHANFFIQRGGSASREMVMLISHCKEVVHRKTGVLLEEEIQYVA